MPEVHVLVRPFEKRSRVAFAERTARRRKSGPAAAVADSVAVLAEPWTLTPIRAAPDRVLVVAVIEHGSLKNPYVPLADCGRKPTAGCQSPSPSCPTSDVLFVAATPRLAEDRFTWAAKAV